jgi:hypothetical protein
MSRGESLLRKMIFERIMFLGELHLTLTNVGVGGSR